jgi:hypothetical protein
MTRDRLNELREAARVRRAQVSAGLERDRERQADEQRANLEALNAVLRPMQPWEYGQWLGRFLDLDGEPTHFYEYPTPLHRWRTALNHFEVLPLYGASAIHIVVPAGIVVTGDGGHNNLYFIGDDRPLYQGFHDTRPHERPSYVPVYSDTEVTR